MTPPIFRSTRGHLVILALVGALALGSPDATAADHLDGPRLTANPTVLGNLDINDVYIFRAFNPKNTVLIMTLSPAAGVLGPAMFNPMGTYQFEIENNNDTTTDLTIQFTFGLPGLNGRQPYQFTATDAAGTVVLSGGGVSGKNTRVKGNGMVRPDLYDDPFFFDLNAFNLFKSEALAGNPNAANVFLDRSVSNIPNDFFAGFNVMAIVLEVPSVLLQSSKKDTNIAVWARTLMPGGVQFDRMGRPAINTVLIPNSDKDAFNSSSPGPDTSFIPIATQELTALFGNPTSAQAHATLLLPDLLTFDTSSSAGFLNGRRLTDDVVDAELSLLSNGAVTTDNVGNDSVFFKTFPYLGTPNPKQVTLKAMQVTAQGGGGSGGGGLGQPDSRRYTFQGTKTPLSGVGSSTGGLTAGAATAPGGLSTSKSGGSTVASGRSTARMMGPGSLTGTSAGGQETSDDAQTETQPSTGWTQPGSSTMQPASSKPKPKAKAGKPKSRPDGEKPKTGEPKANS
jgi:hypothetical protein